MHHRKLVTKSGPLGESPFSDLFSFQDDEAGDADQIILYLGGAISPEDYERRRLTSPHDLAREFSLAVGDSTRRTALLVVPPPPDVRQASRTLTPELLELITEFADSAGGPLRIAGMVGNSLGAHLAVALAPSLAARRVAIVAGVGMLEAAERGGLAASVQDVACFSNYDDPAREHTLRFVEWLQARRVPARLISRPGGHGFLDYLLNGAVREALSFATCQSD